MRTSKTPFLLLFFWAPVGALAAQDPGTAAVPAAATQAIPVQAATLPTVAGPDSEAPAAVHTSALRNCLVRIQSKCCWSHHNQLGCGSAKADLTFIFGSCRQFFGEPCLPPPPGVPGEPRCSCGGR